MPAEIHLFDIYRSPNIGIFLKTNDTHCLVPRGLALTKSKKISELLHSEVVQISVAGSRLIGPLVVMNNKGILLSRLAEDEEVEALRKCTGLHVEKLNSRFTSVGNLIVANDNGAIACDIFSEESLKTIQRVLDVPVKSMRISNYTQIGAMAFATNEGAIVHPVASDEEIERMGHYLKVHPEPATINGGVPFVGSGCVGNTRGILLGNLSRGGELVIVGRAFSN